MDKRNSTFIIGNAIRSGLKHQTVMYKSPFSSMKSHRVKMHSIQAPGPEWGLIQVPQKSNNIR